MSDLAEFLLARIAEDETGAHVLLAREDGLDVPVSQWLGFLPGRGSFAARMLAECEAKRRIVQQYHQAYEDFVGVKRAMPGDDFESRLGRREFSARVLALSGVLSEIAAPYADHPDYRQEWTVD